MSRLDVGGQARTLDLKMFPRKELPHDLRGLFRGEGQYVSDPLTARERQVLKLDAEGRTSREIAALQTP